MKVTDHIAAANGKTLFSFEVLPPLVKKYQKVTGLNKRVLGGAVAHRFSSEFGVVTNSLRKVSQSRLSIIHLGGSHD